MRLACLTCCVLFLAVGCASAGEEPAQGAYAGPIIDVHLHALPYSNFGGAAPNPVTGQAADEADDATMMRRTLEAMDRYDIRRGVVSGPMDHVKTWLDAGEGKLLGGIYLGESAPWPPIGETRAFLEREDVATLGELGLQYMGVSPRDPSMEPYWTLAEELDLPVGLHTGLGAPGTPYRPGSENFRVHFGNPAALEEVLVEHPDLRVYLMHGGWPYLEDTKAILYMYEQVYVDISVINWVIPREEFHAFLEDLMRAGFGKRIMFGSDQMIWPEAIGMAIEGVDSAPFLSPEEKADIFYNNARRFFGWEDLPEYPADAP